MSSKISGKTREFVEISKVRQDIAALHSKVDTLENNVDAVIDLPSTIEKPDAPNKRIVRIYFYNYRALGAGMEDLIEFPKVTISDMSGSLITNGSGGSGGQVSINKLDLILEKTGVYFFELELDSALAISNIIEGSYKVEISANYGSVITPNLEYFSKSFEVVELSGIASGFTNVIASIEENRALSSLLSTVELIPFCKATNLLSTLGNSIIDVGITTSNSYSKMISVEIKLPTDVIKQDSEVYDNTVFYDLTWKSQMDVGLGTCKWMINTTDSLVGAIDITDEINCTNTAVSHLRKGEIKESVQGAKWYLILAGHSNVIGDQLTLSTLSSSRVKFTCKSFAI